MGPIANQSATCKDVLTEPVERRKGDNMSPDVSVPYAQGRCRYSPRLPLLMTSAYAKHNDVGHSITIKARSCASSRTTGSRVNTSTPP